jgi:alpha-beta hydrolase superfamily lysophospholipase
VRAIVVFTGAFNGIPHTERLVGFLRKYGDVHVVEYTTRRFFLIETIEAAYASVDGRAQYEEIVLVGASLGGLISARFVEYDQLCGNGKYAGKISAIIADAPLGPQHLFMIKKPAFLVRIAPHLRVHVGPLFNLLSPCVTRAMFKQVVDDKLAWYTDKEQLARHMKDMWSRRLSLMAEQISVITTQGPLQPLGLTMVWLQCTDDDIVLSDPALSAWKQIGRVVESITVDSQHAGFVEHHDAWRDGLSAGMRALGHIPEQ